MEEAMILLRFTKRFQCYNAGEIAGFSEQDAEAILSVGAAAIVEPTPEAAPEPAKKPAKK